MTNRTAVRILCSLLALAASSAFGPVVAAGAAPAERVFEMVTPLDKNGGAVSSRIEQPNDVELSSDGNAVLFRLQPAALADSPSNFGNSNYFLAERWADGWRSRAMSPRMPEGTGPPPAATTPQVIAASGDLTRILFQTTWLLDGERDRDNVFLDQDLYLRRADGQFGLISCLTAWVCDTPVDANPVVSTPDLGHIVFRTEEPLVPGAASGPQLYDNFGGQLRLVGKGTPLFGGAPLSTTSGPPFGRGRGVISEDGSRVFFRSPGTFASGSNTDPVPEQRLYVRIDNTKTIEVSRTHNDAALPFPRFMGATPDGNTALFTSAVALTPDDTNTVDDLYAWRYDPATETDSLQRVAALPQVGPAGDPSPNYAGAGAPDDGPTPLNVAAISTDPSQPVRVYFTTRTGSGNNSPPDPPEPATVNLFVATDPASPSGTVRFVAKLSQGNNGIGLVQCVGQTTTTPSCARTTADGRLLAFDARAPLTPDDQDTNGTDTCTPASQPLSGPGSTTFPSYCKYDTFVYDAEALSLERISVGSDGPGGARGNASAFDARLGLASNSPSIMEDGTVFFLTSEALVPEDANTVQDVYEFSAGQVGLVSAGRSDAVRDTFYVRNSADGRSVLFSTESPLDPRDTDGAFDIYDARVGGGFPEPVSCDALADGCQGSEDASPLVPSPHTGETGEGDPSPPARKVLWVSGLGREARRRAARTGRVALPVRLNVPGSVTAAARARVGKRTRKVAGGSVELASAGKATLRLRLSGAARRQLRRGRGLELRITAQTPGARTRTVTVRLPGVSS